MTPEMREATTPPAPADEAEQYITPNDDCELDDTPLAGSGEDGEITRKSVIEWVAEQDGALAGAIEALEAQTPGMFATEEERFKFAVELGRLLGRRELLHEAARDVMKDVLPNEP